MARRGRHSAGFTVIELLIVVALVASMAVALSMGVRRVRNSDLRNDTATVAAVLRTAYNLSAMTGRHHRVVFNLDEQWFVLETCEGEVKLHKERREEGEDAGDIDQFKLDQAMRFLAGDPKAGGLGGSDILPEVQGAVTQEEAAAKAAALAGSRIGVARCAPAVRPDGKPHPAGTPRKIRTWNDIKIERIFVQHLEDPQTKGTVSINFFPLGYAEKAVIEMVVEDRDQPPSTWARYTLLVHGLTGRVEFKDGDWRKPEEHMGRDGAGDRVVER